MRIALLILFDEKLYIANNIYTILDKMKVVQTHKFKIVDAKPGKIQSMNLTMRRYTKCVNYYLYNIVRGRLMEDIYEEAKTLYKLPTGLVQTARDVANEQYRSYNNNDNNHTFPHFRGMTTVRLDKRTINFFRHKGKYRTWANITTVDGKVKVPIHGNRVHIEKLFNDKYISAQLKFKNDEYYLHVIFEYEKEIPAEKEFQHFIGVDRGSHNNVATIVIMNRHGRVLKSKFYSAKLSLEKRRRFSKLRRNLGKKKLIKEIKKSKDRETNYINDQLHKISADIINIANKYENSVIVLEKLDNIRDNMKWSKKNNRKGHSWAFKKLEIMLTYKAHGNGIAIRRVYPRGTSSTCKDCFGSIRRSPSIRAVCKNCKKVYNADWLGAVNIVRRLFYYMYNNLGDSESRPKHYNNEPMVGDTAPDSNSCLVTRLAMS